MNARLLALLLAIAMAAGLASPVLAASHPDVAALVDGGARDLEPALPVTPVAIAAPVRRELRAVVVLPVVPSGRLYRAWVFRPPR